MSCLWVGFFTLSDNGCVYETFGISKRFHIKLQLLLIRAVPLEYALHRQLTMPRVSLSLFIFPVIFLSICYFVSYCRALGQTHAADKLWLR